MCVTDGKADFVQDHHGRWRDHCSGILQWSHEIGDWAQLCIQPGPMGIYSQRLRQWVRKHYGEKKGIWLK